MHVIFTRGLPASGKSTWVREFLRHNEQYRRWNNDDYNMMVTGQSFGRMSAQEIANHRRAFITNVTSVGHPLILDNTNLNPYTVDEFHEATSKAGYEVEIKEFRVSLEECLRRNEGRDTWIPPQVIERMAEQWGHLYDWI